MSLYYCHLCLTRYTPFFFFFNDTATTEIYTLSLHDTLPIFAQRAHAVALREHHPAILHDGDSGSRRPEGLESSGDVGVEVLLAKRDRKSTRLNSSHLVISYAVFCLKKKTTLRVS